MARKKLGELLVQAGLVTETNLRAALAEQRRWGGTLGRTLIEMKMLREEDLVRTLSSQLGIQAVDLDAMAIPKEVIDLVPGELAQQWSAVPFGQPMKFLDVAMADPTNLGIADELRIRTQLNIRPYLAGPKMIERAIAKYYGRGFGMYQRAPEVSPIELASPDNLDPATLAPARAAQASSVGRGGEGIRPYPRAQHGTAPPPIGLPRDAPTALDAEVTALQSRISNLEALVHRDEEVLRKVLALLIEKGLATREEILERLR
jgi:type IV pilus assembly protein PilB